jgi:TPR repeat protein
MRRPVAGHSRGEGVAMRVASITSSISFLIAAALAGQAFADSPMTSVPPLSRQQLAEALAQPEVQQARQLMRDPARDADVFTLFAAATAQGNPVAEAYLGYLYYTGWGVSQNDRTAADWYRRSAMHGFADSQVRLGLMYLSGRNLGGVDRSLQRDEQEGENWIRQGAEGGSLLRSIWSRNICPRASPAPLSPERRRRQKTRKTSIKP